MESIGKVTGKAIHDYEEACTRITHESLVRFNRFTKSSYTLCAIYVGNEIAVTWRGLTDPSGRQLDDFREVVRMTISNRDGIESIPHDSRNRPLSILGGLVEIEITEEMKRLEDILAQPPGQSLREHEQTIATCQLDRDGNIVDGSWKLGLGSVAIDWSDTFSPKEWKEKFRISDTTWTRWISTGKIVPKPGSTTKKVSLQLSDFVRALLNDQSKR